MRVSLPAALLFASSAVISSTVTAEWQGSVEGEYLWFAEDATFEGQEDSYLSGAIEPEYFYEWNNGYDVFNAKVFYRKDQFDEERTHGDIRELAWLHAAEDWEINVGISKVFWGVTESIHLVDIINQTDFVENVDGEDKLGQPMVNLSLIRDWGVVSMFVLPGFREATFPGVNGRPRFGVIIDTDNPQYESGAENKHVDFAIRYSHYIGDWEFGISHFSGTAREPRFIARIDNTGKLTSIIPLYELINQTSLDVQATIGDWLWKLEGYIRSGQGDTYTAAAGGFEYTLVGVFGSQADIGLISEYLYDGRGDEITPASLAEAVSLSPFQNDLTIGLRLTLNDVQSTELLVSVIEDLDSDGRSFNLEASRRIGDSWILAIEARGVSDILPTSALASFEKDNRVSTRLTYYF
ncbi:MAG: hypothetical protein ACC650_07995 [Gammaproteobacteria bacterium]